MMRFCCTMKGRDLDIRFSPGVTSYFEFCLFLPQHSWDLASDEIQVLSSLAKVLHFPGSLRKSPNDAAPHTPERQTTNFEKDTDSYNLGNICQPNGDVLEKTTSRSASAAFAPPRMSKLFKKLSTAKTGYYGPHTFLDIQDEFNGTFGI